MYFGLVLLTQAQRQYDNITVNSISYVISYKKLLFSVTVLPQISLRVRLSHESTLTARYCIASLSLRQPVRPSNAGTVLFCKGSINSGTFFTVRPQFFFETIRC